MQNTTNIWISCGKIIDQSNYLNSGRFFFYNSGRPGDHAPFLETPGNSGRLGRSAVVDSLPVPPLTYSAYRLLDCAFRRWKAAVAAASGSHTSLPYYICCLNLEQSRVVWKSQYVPAARCIPAAEYTVQTFSGPWLVRSPPFWKAISPRLLSARFLHQSGHLSVIVCYAPTETSDDAAKDQWQFYDDRIAHRGIIGPVCFGFANDNGSRLLDLCAYNDLRIGSSWFPRKRIHQLTMIWYSNDENSSNLWRSTGTFCFARQLCTDTRRALRLASSLSE